MKKIRYIGNKEFKPDNVAGTGLVWNGKGSIHEVPDAAVAKLLVHSGIWELVADDLANAPVSADLQEKSEDQNPETLQPDLDQSEVDTKPPLANIDTMDKEALISFAQRQFGHEFHHATGEAKMRQTIIGLMNRG
jgi:poly-gamma-glutamate capsule biosynthesis protein CapA/YwtB (metallophosphatase superfamily)